MKKNILLYLCVISFFIAGEAYADTLTWDKVLEEALLSWLVVVRSNYQGRVCTGAGCPARQTQCFLGAVGTGAGHHFGAAGRRLDNLGDYPFVLLVRQRGRFAGRTHGANAVRARLNLKINLCAQGVQVEFTIPKGCD